MLHWCNACPPPPLSGHCVTNFVEHAPKCFVLRLSMSKADAGREWKLAVRLRARVVTTNLRGCARTHVRSMDNKCESSRISYVANINIDIENHRTLTYCQSHHDQHSFQHECSQIVYPLVPVAGEKPALVTCNESFQGRNRKLQPCFFSSLFHLIHVAGRASVSLSQARAWLSTVTCFSRLVLCSSKGKQRLSYSAREIVGRYARGGLWLDLVSILPWDNVGLILSTSQRTSTLLKVCHLTRLVKLSSIRTKSQVRRSASLAVCVKSNWLYCSCSSACLRLDGLAYICSFCLQWQHSEAHQALKYGWVDHMNSISQMYIRDLLVHSQGCLSNA